MCVGHPLNFPLDFGCQNGTWPLISHWPSVSMLLQAHHTSFQAEWMDLRGTSTVNHGCDPEICGCPLNFPSNQTSPISWPNENSKPVSIPWYIFHHLATAIGYVATFSAKLFLKPPGQHKGSFKSPCLACVANCCTNSGGTPGFASNCDSGWCFENIWKIWTSIGMIIPNWMGK